MSPFPELPPLPPLDIDMTSEPGHAGVEGKPEVARIPGPGSADNETAALVRAAMLKRGMGDASPSDDADPEIARLCRERRAMTPTGDRRAEDDADSGVAGSIRARIALRGAPESGAPEKDGHDETVEAAVRAKLVGRNAGQGSGDEIDEDMAQKIKAGLAISGLRGRKPGIPDGR